MEKMKIISSMSLEEKIAQTFMVDFRTWNGEDMTVLPVEAADAVSRYKFGSVILFANNLRSIAEVQALTGALQRAAVKDGGLPLLIATDQEGGNVVRLTAGTVLPGSMALAASGKPENARIAGRIIGSELLAVGINCTLAPVLDINCNANNPIIGLRSFGDDPKTVTDFGIAFSRGISESGAAGCIKHFPGHGDTAVDSHYGLPVVDRSYDELKHRELIPFEAAVKAGAEMVMTAHILYPQLDSTAVYSEKTGRAERRPTTMSRRILTGILREEMGFDGVICTDALNMAGVSANFGEVQAAVEALNAGADMLCMPAADIGNGAGLLRYEALIRGIKTAVEDGVLPESRLDDAVRRILTLKMNKGMLDYTSLPDESDASSYPDEPQDPVVPGNPAFRAEERRMAEEAVTLVRNDRRAFPIDPASIRRLLLMCPYANECASMLSGFASAIETLNCQNTPEVRTFQFSSSAFTASGSLLENLEWADAVIVISEISSAGKMHFSSWFSAGVKNVTEYCSEAEKVCIVISADKPYDVQLYPDASAVLAVYGSKAEGPNISAGVKAALGAIKISGRLPVNIPRFDPASGLFTSDTVFPGGAGL